jgi:fatty acid desaturase
MEDITRSELHRFEANLNASVRTAVDRATAAVFRIASALVGGCCSIAALVLLLGHWFPWCLSFALTGLTVIGIGEVIYYTHHRNLARCDAA